MKFLARFMENESGATAIEYGLIASLISVVIIGSVGALGTSIDSTFGSISGAMSG